MRDALSTLDQLLAGSGPEGLTYDRTVALLGYTDDSLLDEMMDAFAAGNGAAVFGTVDRVVEGGHDPRRFAADLLDRLRDLIILAAVPGAGQSGLLDAPADRLERMAEQAGRFGQAELTRAAEIISEGLIQMRGTTSSRLLLELMCAQVLLPAASTGEKALLARLERLEHQLAGVETGPAETGGRPGGQRGGSAADQSGPAADRGGSAADQSGPGADRGGPAAARGAPAVGRGETEQDPEDDQDGPGLRGDVGARDGAGRRGDADSHGDAGPGKDVGQRGDARPRGDAGTRGDAGPRSDVGSHGDPGPQREAPDARGGTGPVDVGALRQRWPEILDAVRSKSKVAWILLNTASVQELEGGTLTIAFPSEGNARGFASSGHDQVLTGALAALLGLNVRVRAVAGGPQSAGSPAAGTQAASSQATGRAARARRPAAAQPRAGHTRTPRRVVHRPSAPPVPVRHPGIRPPRHRPASSRGAAPAGRSRRRTTAVPPAPPRAPPPAGNSRRPPALARPRPDRRPRPSPRRSGRMTPGRPAPGRRT